MSKAHECSFCYGDVTNETLHCAVRNGATICKRCTIDGLAGYDPAPMDEAKDSYAEGVARKLYHAYGSVTEFKNYAGLPMPAFNDLPERIKQAWSAVAARAVVEGMMFGPRAAYNLALVEACELAVTKVLLGSSSTGEVSSIETPKGEEGAN